MRPTRRIRNASRELAVTAMEAENDWQRVEQIYDYVREHVEYVEGSLKNASDALQGRTGDCEEMTSLFVALCRNARIPARMVWIPDHCYPEFYLEDAQGQGYWFPCQAAGTRQFGRMDEYRPVLQKGDRFKVPEKKVPVRYVSEFFRCDRKGKSDPRPNFRSRAGRRLPSPTGRCLAKVSRRRRSVRSMRSRQSLVISERVRPHHRALTTCVTFSDFASDSSFRLLPLLRCRGLDLRPSRARRSTSALPFPIDLHLLGGSYR